MKIKKPLMVKLSAGLLAACGVVLPAMGVTPGWNETPAGSGNWVLTGTSTQIEQLAVADGKMATLSSGSLWNKFDPTMAATDPAAAIYFDGNGTLKLNGGRLAISVDSPSAESVGVFSSDTLTVASWISSSTVTVNNFSGDATAAWGYNVNIGVQPIDLPGNPYDLLPRATNVFSGSVSVTSSQDAYGLYADDALNVWGNLNGAVTVTGDNAAYGVMADGYDGIFIAGALSGRITATARHEDAYAMYSYNTVEVLGTMSGTLMVNSSIGSGDAYGIYAANENEDFGIWIGGNLSGKVTATANLGDSEAYACGLYAGNYGDIAVGGALSGTVTVTGYDATGLYADDNILISGKLSGNVTATATDDAYGLEAGYGIRMGSDLSGKVTVKGDYAYGLKSAYIAIGDAEAGKVGNLSGLITVTGFDNAYGLDTYEGIYINGNLSGSITVTGQASDSEAAGLYAWGFISAPAQPAGYSTGGSGFIDVTGSLSGRVTVLAGDQAYGLSAGNELRIGKDLSGVVKAITTGDNYYAMAVGLRAGVDYYDAGGVYIAGSLSGTVSASSPTGIAMGVEGYNIGMYGHLSGSVTATGGWGAVALMAENDLQINGNLSGRVNAKSDPATTGYAYAGGLVANNDIRIYGNVTGTVTAIATPTLTEIAPNGEAIGIGAFGSLFINGNLSGSTTTAADWTAGAFAGNFESVGQIPMVPGGTDHMLRVGKDLSGKMTVTAGTAGFGLVSMGDLNVVGRVSGTIAVKAAGAAYGMGAADFMLLGTDMATLVSPAAPSSPVLLSPVLDVTGTITATGGQEAYGLFAGPVAEVMRAFMVNNGWFVIDPITQEVIDPEVGTIAIAGNLGGKVTVKAGGIAMAVVADQEIWINRDLTGAITASTATSTEPAAQGSLAAGLLSRGSIDLIGRLSGSVTATADRAIGVGGGQVNIGTLSGKVVANGATFALGVVADPEFFLEDAPAVPSGAPANPMGGSFGDLHIGVGGLTGTVTATSGSDAIGLGATNSLVMEGALAGSIVSQAYNADGIYAGNGIYLMGNLSGKVTALAGMYADGLDSGGDLLIGGSLLGTVVATGGVANGSGGEAFGLYAEGTLGIVGNLSGAVTATAKGVGYNDAYGLFAGGHLAIAGTLSGKVIATSTLSEGDAVGLYSVDGLAIAGGITKTGSVSATGNNAIGLRAGGSMDDGLAGPLLIAGTVKAVGQTSAVAIMAGGPMNLKITGTASATASSAYAIFSTAPANDTIEFGNGAKIVGNVSLGSGDTDTLILSGHGTCSGNVSGVEVLTVNADSTGWQISGLDGQHFDSMTLNSGVFGLGTSQLVHVTTDSFVQKAGSTMVIKLTNDDSDTITTGFDGREVGSLVRFVKFGGGTRSSCQWLFTAGPSPVPVKLAPSALFDSTVTSETTTEGTTYSVDVVRRSLAPMASANNEGIAEALDQTFDNGQGDDVLAGLASMAAPRDIDTELSKFQPVSAPTYVTLSGSQKFTAGVSSHLELVRDGMRIAAQPVNSRMPSLAGMGDTAVGEVLQAVRAAASETTEWQVSGRYMNDNGRLDSDGSAAGNTWRTNGFMINLDRQIDANLLIGAAAGGNWSSIDIRRNSGEAETTSLNTRLYAAWFDGPWHVDAQVGYGYNWNESKRYMDIIQQTAKGKWNSDVYTASLGGGYDIELGDGWIVEPNAALDYTRIASESYKEDGSSSNLAVDAQAFDSLRSQLGMALRKGFKLNDSMTLRPEARLTWAHEYLDTQVRTAASLFGSSFTTNGVKQDRDSAIVGLGLNMQFSESLGGYVSYDAELSSDKTSQGLSVGLRFNF